MHYLKFKTLLSFETYIYHNLIYENKLLFISIYSSSSVSPSSITSSTSSSVKENLTYFPEKFFNNSIKFLTPSSGIAITAICPSIVNSPSDASYV